MNTRVLAAMLSSLGATSEIVFDGARAIERCLDPDATWNAVLMDCEMPEVDGYEAARRLRAAGFTTPIIAVSAHVLPEFEARARAAGMVAFVAKPVRRAQLTNVLLATSTSTALPRNDVTDRNHRPGGDHDSVLGEQSSARLTG